MTSCAHLNKQAYTVGCRVVVAVHAAHTPPRLHRPPVEVFDRAFWQTFCRRRFDAGATAAFQAFLAGNPRLPPGAAAASSSIAASWPVRMGSSSSLWGPVHAASCALLRSSSLLRPSALLPPWSSSLPRLLPRRCVVLVPLPRWTAAAIASSAAIDARICSCCSPVLTWSGILIQTS